MLVAYCGSNTIDFCLAENAKKVVGVEVIGQAVINAKENAKISSIYNMQFILGKAEELLLEEKVIGQTVTNAKENAKINSIYNVQFRLVRPKISR